MKILKESRQTWLERINRLKASGKNAKEWAAEEKISHSNLIRWIRISNQESKSVEKHPQIEKWKELIEEPLELKWRNIRITFSKIDDLKLLKSLLDTVC